MSDQDAFDARLAAHFENEHRHVSADTFVAATMRNVRREHRRNRVMRTCLRAAALVAVVAASPWLIASVERLNAALEFSLKWAAGLPGIWILGALAMVAAVARLLRRR